MSSSRHAAIALALSTFVMMLTGCASVMHELQPHRLHQMNRTDGDPMSAEDYSVLPTGAVPIC
ncbi:hypothetical protein [Stratiformator vulcanicus]|uniref:Lipoprotein n=1 Tax=Stratiformator vulcanicus TaxID=2527980 RepID=A0A517R4Y7_9PLAN|nr:hypothetical protein [Stratiformator vulcanicus]QDT38949.1 hypothetical protein Pan189_33490 [Stratiformator vulcanicus]